MNTGLFNPVFFYLHYAQTGIYQETKIALFRGTIMATNYGVRR